MTEIKEFKEIDKIEKLGEKICRFVEYYEGDKGQNSLALAAIADVLFSIREIFRGYEERLKTVEAKLGIYTKEEIRKIKVGGTDPD